MASIRRAFFAVFCALVLVAAPAALADTTPHVLSASNFSQNWSNTGLITTSDVWTGVPSITGFRGDGLTTTGVDPQTVLADDTPGVIDVNANQTAPNTFTTGGVTEFHITDPVVALQGSGTADAPYLQIYLDTTGRSSIAVSYNIRDIDGSADNAVQAVALHYRIGGSGTWTNVPAAFVSDATTGPSLATLVTPVQIVLPAAADNQPLVQIRIMTADATGSDEHVGIDDINITSSPLAVNLSVNDVTVTEGNAGTTNAAFTVSLNFPAPPGGVTFDIATADNSATTADGDYVANSVIGATIPAGFTTYAFNVTVNGDTNVEPSEAFFVNVTNVTGAVPVDPQGLGTIANDDSAPVLSIADAAKVEGNSGTSILNLTVSLSAPAGAGGVTFDIATADDTATAGTDYVANSVIGATIPAGNSTFTFPVTINGDATFEPNETFFVNVTNVTGATVGDAQAIGTITNDDTAPALAIGDAVVTEGNAGTQMMTFTVTLSAASGSTTTVSFATADGSATVADSDYIANSGTLTFVAGDTSETIDVTINGDTFAEGNEQFLVNLSGPSGATINDGVALGIIRMDDPFSIAAVDTVYGENFDTLAGGTNGTLAATTPAAWTSSESGANANQTYRVDNGGSNAGETYSYGTTAAADRALGALRSGSLVPTFGAFYRNDTGVTITTLSVSYFGEQWRLGTAGRTDRIDFQYSTSATSLTTGTWLDVNDLDFTTPNTVTIGSKDGNAGANRLARGTTISGLSIAPGAMFWIRWNDFDASGADDGLAVDDFSIIANINAGLLSIDDVTVTEGNAGTTTASFTVSLTQPAGPTGVTFDIATADGTATTADNDYVANATSVTIPPGGVSSTFNVTVNGDVNVEPTETFFVNITNVFGAILSDGQGLGTITGDDFTFTPIHDVQGSGNVSPFNGSTVTVNGIVTGIKSGSSGGFFVQGTDVDADPNSSEGIFVFTGSSVPPGAVIGNRVAVTGTVIEFPSSAVPHAVTELGSPVSVSVLATGQPLPAPVVLTAADGTPSANVSQYERYEGMRVAATLTVVAPTQGSVNEANATSTSNGVFYGVIPTTPRPFREAGIPLTDIIPSEAPCAACIPRFDTNPEKLRVDSDNQPGATQLNVGWGQTVSNLVGPLDFGFFEYTLLPEAATPPTVSGTTGYVAAPARTASELTVSSFNLQRFYDTVDDPGVSDVALTSTALNNRLNKASLAIRNVLNTPDVVGVVEVENLGVLQTLAAKINTDTAGATSYVAYLIEGNDIGGIDVGFLVNANRVTVNSVTQEGASATFVNPDTLANELLNDRPPLVLTASIPRIDATLYNFTVIVNHLRSLNGVETDNAAGRRVRAKRAAQAEFLANLVQTRQSMNPNERIILVGDFNAFDVSDGLVDVMGTIQGTPAPSNMVVRSSPDLVNPDLTNLISTLPAASRLRRLTLPWVSAQAFSHWSQRTHSDSSIS
ncbi:MAG TPA: Calx-beta domain-containing protein, partial [Thermoanaerobaculia bacterium]|nr:Calx-beta domain-containing protein [Thermoanaerobaculia bacterium]